jgi:hypothetical protein
MKSDAKHLLPLPDFMLQVELVDGRRGVFDLKPYLHLPGFKALRDPAYFAQVNVFCGAATWPDGEDIAPESLEAELKTMASA